MSASSSPIRLGSSQEPNWQTNELLLNASVAPVLDWNPRVLQCLHSIKYVSTGNKSASSQQSPRGRRSNWLISSNVRLNCGLNRRSLRPGPIAAMWAWKARRRFLPNSAGYALGWKGKHNIGTCYVIRHIEWHWLNIQAAVFNISPRFWDWESAGVPTNLDCPLPFTYLRTVCTDVLRCFSSFVKTPRSKPSTWGMLLHMHVLFGLGLPCKAIQNSTRYTWAWLCVAFGGRAVFQDWRFQMIRAPRVCSKKHYAPKRVDYGGLNFQIPKSCMVFSWVESAFVFFQCTPKA
jgi:hypothetical protein